MARNSVIGWVKVLLAAAILAAGTQSATARQPFCTDRAIMVAQLSEKFQERQLAYGAIGQVAVMEIFVAERGTWTIVITDVTGRSCIIAVGEGWESDTIVAGRGVWPAPA